MRRLAFEECSRWDRLSFALGFLPREIRARASRFVLEAARSPGVSRASKRRELAIKWLAWNLDVPGPRAARAIDWAIDWQSGLKSDVAKAYRGGAVAARLEGEEGPTPHGATG